MARTHVKKVSNLPSAGSVAYGDLIYVEATGHHYAKNAEGNALVDLGEFESVIEAELAAERLRAEAGEASITGAAVDTDATMAANSDAVVPSQKAVKAFALPVAYLDTNTSLTNNSDTKVASQKAAKAYVDAAKAACTKAPVAAPGTASSTGTAGTWAYDATHLYICIATDTWVRCTLASW